MRRGVVLLETVVAFFLIFLVAMIMLNVLQTSEFGYSQAADADMALRLARDGLDRLRSGSLTPVAGTQTLAQVSLKHGLGSQVFTPALVCSSSGSLWLVRSRVSWGSNPTHVLELKTYVPQ